MATQVEDDEPKPNSDYEVGYGKPPVSGQFKPGKSGNPKGRKTKPKSVQAQVQKALSRKVRITDAGQSKQLPFQDVIVRGLVTKAAKGDLKAAAFVFNLANSPLYADTDTLSEDTLSPEDKAMLEKMMKQYSDPDASEQSSEPEALNETALERDPVQAERIDHNSEQIEDDPDV